MHVAITGIAAVSGLGNDLAAHARRMEAGEHSLRPLSGLLGADAAHSALGGAWIEPRTVMRSRKWAPGSALSLHVAKQAIADAGLTGADLADAAVIVGSSRGNVAGWVAPWPGRRPFDLMAASNSMHGELASAVSIELGIRGPWQVIASGCAASLDAMGLAWMMIRQGLVRRAVVIGVELPLVSEVLDTYAKTGVLATTAVNDPYSPQAGGFFPGEAGAAVVLEAVASGDPGEAGATRSPILMTGYWCNSDAASPIGMPTDGAGLRDCVRRAVSELDSTPPIAAVCPHASGTLLHGKAELAALRESLPRERTISLHPLKPYTGHTVGASGVLDAVILAHYMRDRTLPPNLPGLTPPGEPFDLRSRDLDPAGATVLKIAVGMGGHNSVIAMCSPGKS